MINQNVLKTPVLRIDNKLQADSLASRCDRVLVAIAILGLYATISDGKAELREVDTFTREFSKRYLLSKKQSTKIIWLALKHIRDTDTLNTIDFACDTINENLNPDQKLNIFELLSDVLIADKRIQVSEEYFLDYITEKLNLITYLKKQYQIN